ncbi:SCP2 sterol-binding domain-containing protein [Mycolicibacterium holsaticum]|uniref:SCP2 domain-containing protein n=1 Tax=Mycolicibacterium holsaticum TaxID=152142 RepID=A0A1E3S2T8_9MYCO|nr:SCP2 sterol-binding domain-containing protein [Mycolicibacterium holsaticum]ODQ96483.1 hypothetical protein BHQ17_01005 [Mycolicibacterium holsaticum]QZA12747.1 SCP2 sterol-binding domain-containing protein [Mycolicibacterium holsaticum DSM 44478 = JCM 12374]UNC09779.1 SCP2 sterol-binding domain-containing protein [Mycolicibacterium holsaticum DSM 44478 = JCM 12374]
MTVKFGTLSFYEVMAEQLNNDLEWKDIGKNLSYAMVYNYEAPLEGSFYTKFDNGEVVEVREASPVDIENADFVISGSSDVWKDCFTDAINPTVAMTRGKLRVRGKMTQLLKNMAAFQYVITAMKRVDFE